MASLVGIGIFVGTTRTEIKHLKEDNKNLKIQIEKDIKSEVSLIDSKLDGRMKVLETDLKNSKDQLGRQENEIKEQIRYSRNFGNKLTEGKLGLNDD